MTDRWRRRIVVIVALLALIEAAMVFTDMGPQLAVISALGLFVASAIWLVVDLDAVAVRPTPQPPPPQPPGGTANLRITALRQGLASLHRDTQVARQLHARLVELVDDALAARGVDRGADPAAAAALMGPELTSYVAGDLPSSPAELGRIVTRIEAL